jgi:hypothetical protein
MISELMASTAFCIVKLPAPDAPTLDSLFNGNCINGCPFWFSILTMPELKSPFTVTVFRLHRYMLKGLALLLLIFKLPGTLELTIIAISYVV